jgi:DNA-binding MarR family transcriptional regulator
MRMVLGLVLHTSHQARLVEASGMLTGVQLELVVYEQEREIRPKVEALLNRVHLDGMILGRVPYDACRDLLPPDLPISINRYSALELTLTLGRALRQGWAPAPVSIDTFDRSVVDDVTTALGMNPEEITCLPYAADISYDQIIDFHERFLAENPDGFVITVRSEVTRALGDRVRLLNVRPLESSVRAELHELVLRIQSKRAKELSFAAGIFSVVDFEKDSNLDRARVGLLNMLLNTPEFADAWVDTRGSRGVAVLAHRALFNEVTNNWSSLPVVGTAHESLGIRVAAGFGFGSSARKCVVLAEKAVAQAEQTGAPCGFLMDEDGLMVGPLRPGATPLSFTYREHGADLERIARQAGLSAATISRLAALDRKLAGRPLSPGDLAEELHITDPSGRRLIRKLAASGLAVQQGSAQANRRGRPTTLYQLTIAAAIREDER